MADRAEVVLPPLPEQAASDIAAASGRDESIRRDSVGAAVARWPAYPIGWAKLSPLGRDAIERYAFARVGYHRGLDMIRGHGWGGNGYVRWRHETNRGVLTCLVRLRDAAREIGEDEEVARIDDFLRQLDPDWNDANVS